MKSILIAEDDQGTRTLLTDALSALEGGVVTAVADGAQPLATLETVTPDLLVLDVNMPGLSGLEVYRTVREREGWGEIPVLFLTAENRAQAQDLDGPFRWMAKPFGIDKLRATVTEVLGVDHPA